MAASSTSVAVEAPAAVASHQANAAVPHPAATAVLGKDAAHSKHADVNRRGQAPLPVGLTTSPTSAVPPLPTKRPHPVPPDAFDESVYRLMPEIIPIPEKEKRYRSKFAEQARKEYVSGRKSTASMGPPKVMVNPPSEFVRKRERETKAPVAPAYEPDRTVRKAPVPKEPGQIPPPPQKDFVKMNALDNINSVAKKPIDNSPRYRFKPDYGRTPEYLAKRMSEASQAAAVQHDHHQQIQQQRAMREGLVMLPEDERIGILDGLKANWEKLNCDYQKLSLTVDTVPKIARKVNMEQQLKQLEDNIHKFSHPNIYVDFNSAYAQRV
ncbi:hypothetical protein HK104_010204 [Borealophlyctis nickersoniae]|nr:hypothetical protein HK104_010204 [Borealophlyctis nickersoniae]